MSLDLTFFLILGLRMAIAAAFVVSASMVAERTGPVIGALVATLPISAGPTYVFLAVDHDAAFIAQGALISLPMNSATIFMSLAYAVWAQRRSMIVSAATAIAVWLVCAILIRHVHWSLVSGVAINAATFAICLPLLQRYCHARMPLITRRWYDVPLRASLVATLVATVSTLSGWVGPTVSGVLAVFPTVFTSMMLILHPRIGGPATAAVMANGAYGMIGFTSALGVLAATALPLGPAAALSLALATCVFWNLGLWWFGRGKAAK
ncbi:hypothetical protein [Bradyrhizobium sp. STM 3557]|uniref:hypothetical protein n=1 Tax=Bradyrhizobium sp. STM 3557 TaxID=578920 RepID=UPI00388D65E9